MLQERKRVLGTVELGLGMAWVAKGSAAKDDFGVGDLSSHDERESDGEGVRMSNQSLKRMRAAPLKPVRPAGDKPNSGE